MKTLDISHCFSTVPPPLDYVLPGMLHGSVGALISPGGAGKSFFALQLAIQLASGFDTLGWDQKLKTGKVAFFAAEDPQSALHCRLHALGQRLDSATRERAAGGIALYPLVGGSDRLDLLCPESRDTIAALGRGSRLIIFDTLRRFHGANENDSGDMSRVVAGLEEIAAKSGASVLFLHHSSKSAALGGTLDEQQSSRGSSVLVDNVRWQGFLSGTTKLEAKSLKIEPERRRFYVRYGNSKQNYGAPFADIWLERREGGTLHVAELGTDEPKATSKDRRRKGGH